MAEGVNVANAYVSIMPSMQGAEKSITDALSGAMEGAGDEAGSRGGRSILDAVTGQLGGLGDRLGELGNGAGSSLVDGITGVLGAAGPAAVATAVTACVIGVGSALEGIGEDFDAMSDSIQISTGASGDALDELGDSAKRVATTVPVSFEEAGGIVAGFSQRMGLAGQALTDVSDRAAALGELTGQAVDIDRLTGAFNAFSVSGEDAAGEMDYLFGVSQQTGMGFNDLVSVVQSSGPAMQELGFSLDDVADMAGQLDKAGLNSSSVLGSMKKALSSVAESGGDVQKTFSDSVYAIERYVSAGDDAAAISAASDIFGTRNAPQFVAALKSGAISMDDLGQSALGAQGDIMGTMEATDDWPEKWKLIQNGAEAALEPLGSAVMGGVTSTVEGLGGALDWLSGALSPLGDTLSGLVDGAMAKVGPVLEPLMPSLESLGSSVLPVIQGAVSALCGALGIVGSALSVVWDILSPVVSVLVSVLGVAIDAVAGALSLLGPVLDAIGVAFQTASDTATAAWEPMSGFFSGVVSAIQGFFSPIGDFIGGVFADGAAFVSDHVDEIKSFVEGIPGAVQGFVSGIPGFFSDAFSQAGQSAWDCVSSVGDAISGLPGKVWDWISSIPSKFSEMWSQVHVPSFHIEGGFNLDPANFSVPSIAFYAAGGFIDRPTAIVGEAGGEFVWPSYQPYIGRYAAALAAAMDGGTSGRGVTINSYTKVVRSDRDLYAASSIANRALLDAVAQGV